MAEGVAAPVVLVIGGTGVFGRLIVADLLTHTDALRRGRLTSWRASARLAARIGGASRLVSPRCAERACYPICH